MKRPLPRFLRKFVRREDGALTAFGLFLIIAMICVGGLGLDVANGVMVRTHLQVAADAAAHAAIIALDRKKTPAEAKAIALSVAQASMPASKFGDAITEDDIIFGTWDAATQVFSPDPNSNLAVMVNSQRLQSRANSVSTYFLRFVGVNNLDVVRRTIFETYYPTCFREGFVAQNVVDVQSNNTYGNGFCIHSNDHVEINNGNTFLDGTIVSMPDKTDMVVPENSTGSNPGLTDALRSGSYAIQIIDQINDIIAGVEDPDSPYFRTDYVNIDPLTSLPLTYVELDSKTGGGIRLSDWVPGAVHTLDCASSKKQVQWGNPDEVFEKGVLITNCIIKFAQGVALHDVIMINNNDDVDSFNSASSFTLGRDDGCADGGGAQLVTKGGVNFAADFQVYGGQIVAAKRIAFSARNDGIEGISLVSGDYIDGASLINVGFCGGAGMNNNFMARYFRLAS